MLRVTCKQCGASVMTDNGSTLGTLQLCICCDQNHDHNAAANACPGAGLDPSEQHPGAACGHSSENGVGCVVLTPLGEPCPGRHCYPGVDGCTVCRPLIIEPVGVAVAGG